MKKFNIISSEIISPSVVIELLEDRNTKERVVNIRKLPTLHSYDHVQLKMSFEDFNKIQEIFNKL